MKARIKENEPFLPVGTEYVTSVKSMLTGVIFRELQEKAPPTSTAAESAMMFFFSIIDVDVAKEEDLKNASLIKLLESSCKVLMVNSSGCYNPPSSRD